MVWISVTTLESAWIRVRDEPVGETVAIVAKQTAELEKWSDVEESTKWPTLLVGNGASVNLWGDFNYPSLYERADLSEVAQAVFADLGVTNFETVLQAIHHAHVVVEALGDRTSAIDAQYVKLRDALFGAVRGVHVNWEQVTDDRFDKIAGVIQDHEYYSKPHAIEKKKSPRAASNASR